MYNQYYFTIYIIYNNNNNNRKKKKKKGSLLLLLGILKFAKQPVSKQRSSPRQTTQLAEANDAAR